MSKSKMTTGGSPRTSNPGVDGPHEKLVAAFAMGHASLATTILIRWPDVPSGDRRQVAIDWYSQMTGEITTYIRSHELPDNDQFRSRLTIGSFVNAIELLMGDHSPSPSDAQVALRDRLVARAEQITTLISEGGQGPQFEWPSEGSRICDRGGWGAHGAHFPEIRF